MRKGMIRSGIGDGIVAVALLPVAFVGISLGLFLAIGYFPIWMWRRGRRGLH